MNLDIFCYVSLSFSVDVVSVISVFSSVGVAACQDQNFGTANLHVEVSDVVSVLVYVGVAKGNGVLSKTGKNLQMFV